MKNKYLYYILSWTWGLPMTLLGVMVALVLIICGYKPKKCGYCYYFEICENWGGIEFGMFFLTEKNPPEYITAHEVGHSLQNCLWGVLMPIVISIPSAIRYWYRRIRVKIGKPCTAGYYDIWFERQASEWGTKFINNTTK